MRLHGLSWFVGAVMTTSLDHVMWLYGPIRFDEWHLYSSDNPFSGAGRGFNRGSVLARDGRLVAGVAQDGLVRPAK